MGLLKADQPFHVLRSGSGRSGLALKEMASVLEQVASADDLSPAARLIACINTTYRSSRISMTTIPNVFEIWNIFIRWQKAITV